MLVFGATGQPVGLAIRVIAVPGAILAAGLLLDAIGGQRDRLLLPLVALLTTLGVVFLARLDLFMATKQILWVLMGSALMAATYFLIDDVRTLSRLKYVSGAAALALLAVTALWGTEAQGARLWLAVPGLFSFQPGELAKLLMAIFLAGYIAEHARLRRDRVLARPLIPMLIIVMFGVALLVGQRDLGAAALFFGLLIAMFYLGTGHAGYAAAGVALFLAGAVGAYYGSPHAAARLAIWFSPWQSAQHGGDQSVQTLFCLAEGGIVGAGLGQVSLDNLPVAATDLSLAVVGHDVGLLGAVALVIIYAFLSFRAYGIAQQATDRFGALLAAGLATVFALQGLLITGGAVRLVPLTGLTLPFVSYGGAAMIINFIAIGLLLAVSRDCTPHRRGRTG